MELYKKEILQIFKRNFDYKILETPAGIGVEMPVKDAFIFSSITGSGYLDNPVLPFTPKGLIKLFYNAFHYNFVTGIFDNTSLKNTPYLLSLAKPYLSDGRYKYIIPVEFSSESELQKLLRQFIKLLPNPTDYIILRIETSKSGNGLESFMEYLACSYFAKKGYICENQIPLAHSVGSPDFGGYSLPEIFKIFKGSNLFPSGFNVIELALLRVFPTTGLIESIDAEYNLIVGEAKTSTSLMANQLNKYLATSLFDEGFEIHPSKSASKLSTHGLLSLGDDFTLIYYPALNVHGYTSASYNKQDYIIWLENYFKYYLIANLTNDEFLGWYQKENNRQLSSEIDLVNFVNGLSFERIIKHLKSTLS